MVNPTDDQLRVYTTDDLAQIIHDQLNAPLGEIKQRLTALENRISFVPTQDEMQAYVNNHIRNSLGAYPTFADARRIIDEETNRVLGEISQSLKPLVEGQKVITTLNARIEAMIESNKQTVARLEEDNKELEIDLKIEKGRLDHLTVDTLRMKEDLYGNPNIPDAPPSIRKELKLLREERQRDTVETRRQLSEQTAPLIDFVLRQV